MTVSRKRIFSLFSLIFLFISHTQAADINTSVPFANITLVPGQVLHANYAFGVNAIIFCYENNLQLVGNVKWPFKRAIHSSSLPVTLVTNSNYQGSFANASGVIQVSNTSPQQLIISCEFAF